MISEDAAPANGSTDRQPVSTQLDARKTDLIIIEEMIAYVIARQLYGFKPFIANERKMKTFVCLFAMTLRGRNAQFCLTDCWRNETISFPPESKCGNFAAHRATQAHSFPESLSSMI